MRGDGLLGLLDTDGSLGATGLVALTTDADVIRVCAAPALGVADDQPTAALAAVDAPLEIVRVLVVALAGQVVEWPGAKLPRLLNQSARLTGMACRWSPLPVSWV